MTARIVVIVCGMAIVAASLTALVWERAKPTPGEIEARNLSALATAALSQAQAAAAADQAPARENAMTALLWGVVAVAITLTAGVTVWLNVYLAWRAHIHVRAIPETGAAVLAPGNRIAVIAPMTRARAADLAAPTPAVQIAAPADPLTAPAWSIVRQSFTPTPDRLLLGYSSSGLLTAPLSDLLSTAIVGRSGTGKSSLLRLIVAQAGEIGVRVIAWDLHNSATVPGAELCTTLRDINQSAAGLMRLLDSRYAGRESSDVPVLVVADEAPLLLSQSQLAQDATRRIVLEGRKVRVFMLLAGQSLPAKLFDGGTLIRDGLSSRFAFAASAQTARMAGLDGAIARSVPALPVGHAILDGVVTGRSGPVRIAVPWVEPPPPARRIAAQVQPVQPVQPVQSAIETPVPAQFDAVPPVPVLPRLEWGEEIPPAYHALVRTLAAQGWSQARLAVAIWGKRTPRALDLLSNVLAEVAS